MKNMKVRVKLIVSFLVVVALAIAVGCVGMLGMSRINSADDALYNENVVAISAMGNIRENVQRLRLGLRLYVLYAGDTEREKSTDATMQQLDTQMKAYFEAYEKTITDESAEKDYYEAKEIYLTDYAQLISRVKAAAAVSFEAGIAELDSTDVTTIANKMVEAFTQSAQANDQMASDSVNANSRLFSQMLYIQIGILAFTVAVAITMALYISGMISRPLGNLTAFMNKAGAQGDITLTEEDVAAISEYSKYRDETGQCLASTASFIQHITTISNELEAVAGGDVSIDVKVLSEKDTMGNSMKKMVENLNSMFGEINASTSQVATGAKQIADGSQALAQGSTEQAAAVQQLSASIGEIAEKTKVNAQMAAQAANLANTIKQNAEKGSGQMSEMTEAVRDINQASQSISKVIKVIDDIAFQTNILALNAAVEAARAGVHGKGFAVVAEEVRNLAAKSAEAAKDTGGLIANSMEKAELGAKIADETAASLAEIVSGINESSQIVGDIARSSDEQSAGIAQINRGIDQVAQVVQQNSATAQQSAAASEEMSGQSSMLEQLIGQFKLRNDGRQSWALPGAAKDSGGFAHSYAGPGMTDGDYGKY